MWQQWINGILGIAMTITAFMYVPSGPGRVLLMVIGIAAAIMGFWSAVEHSRRHGNAPAA